MSSRKWCVCTETCRSYCNVNLILFLRQAFVHSLVNNKFRCHYNSWLVFRQIFRAGITIFKLLTQICVNKGHRNFLARSQGCRKNS